jgi:hypothetical protein
MKDELVKALEVFGNTTFIYACSFGISKLSGVSFTFAALSMSVIFFAGAIVELKSKVKEIDSKYLDKLKQAEKRIEDSISFERNMRVIGDNLSQIKTGGVAMDVLDRKYEIRKLELELNRLKKEQAAQ